MSQRQQLERIIEIDRRIREGAYPNAEKIGEDYLLQVVLHTDMKSMKIHPEGCPLSTHKS